MWEKEEWPGGRAGKMGGVSVKVRGGITSCWKAEEKPSFSPGLNLMAGLSRSGILKWRP